MIRGTRVVTQREIVAKRFQKEGFLYVYVVYDTFGRDKSTEFLYKKDGPMLF